MSYPDLLPVAACRPLDAVPAHHDGASRAPMPLTAAEVSARCRARVLSLQPTELDVSSSTHLDAAVGLYHSVLPSISRRYLRKYMRRRGVTTLMLMLPLPSSKEAEEEKEMEEEGEEEEDDDGDDDESEGESAEEEDKAAATAAAAADPGVAAAHRAAVATLRRRLVGVVSYEVGQRLGQRLLQVGLLGSLLA